MCYYGFMNYSDLRSLDDDQMRELFLPSESKFNCLKCSRVLHKKDTIKYKCNYCKKSTSLWKGTLFENRRIPLQTRVELLWLLANGPLTNKQTQRQYSLNANAFQSYQLGVFSLCQQWMSEQLLNGIVEVDETYLGKGLGREAVPAVFIAVEKKRNGRVIALPENSFTKNNCHKLVEQTVDSNSSILTDGWRGYNSIEEIVGKNYNHQVKSSHKQLPQVHSSINNLKKYLSAYIRLPKYKYLQYYLAHWAWLYSHRQLTEEQRFNLLIDLSMQGRVLK